MAIKTASALATRVKYIAQNVKTVYVYGAFGQPVTTALLTQKAAQFPSFYTAAKQKQLAAFAGKGYYGFDCVNLIKGVLWGWDNGGAKYASNGVPDINADTMFGKCSGQSSDFSSIEIGEAVWLTGHIGVYIGSGLVVECTPAWNNCVQITAVGNIGSKSGYHTRRWTKHGRLPYVTYETAKESRYTGTFPVLPSKGYLGKGDTGEQVKRLQAFLNWYGGYGLAVDGSFGSATLEAVKKYQTAAGLEVDGYFGKKSLAAAKTAVK